MANGSQKGGHDKYGGQNKYGGHGRQCTDHVALSTTNSALRGGHGSFRGHDGRHIESFAPRTTQSDSSAPLRPQNASRGHGGQYIEPVTQSTKLFGSSQQLPLQNDSTPSVGPHIVHSPTTNYSPASRGRDGRRIEPTDPFSTKQFGPSQQLLPQTVHSPAMNNPSSSRGRGGRPIEHIPSSTKQFGSSQSLLPQADQSPSMEPYVGTRGRGGRSINHISPSTKNFGSSQPLPPQADQSPSIEAQAVYSQERNNLSASSDHGGHGAGGPCTSPIAPYNTRSVSSGSEDVNVTSEEASNVRGITTGHGARRAMRRAKRRLTVQFDFSLMQAICENSESFNNEIGYIVRKNCSLQYKDWRHVPLEVRIPLRQKLLTLFDIDIEDQKIQKVIDKQMQEAWKGYKFKLHAHFKEIGGEQDPEMAMEKCPDEVNKEDWLYLCNIWVDPKYMERAKQNSSARLKRKYNARNGSMTTARHHIVRGANLHSPTGHIETWRLQVWHPEHGWPSPDIEALYNDMMQLRRENTPEELSDKKILEKVLGRQSVRLVGWGRDPVTGETNTNSRSSRPTYNQLLDELDLYKSRFQKLEENFLKMQQCLIEKDIMPSSFQHVTSDQSSGPSHANTPPINNPHNYNRSCNSTGGIDEYNSEFDDDLC